jgi:type IV secretory pathway component VirB8
MKRSGEKYEKEGWSGKKVNPVPVAARSRPVLQADQPLDSSHVGKKGRRIEETRIRPEETRRSTAASILVFATFVQSVNCH